MTKFTLLALSTAVILGGCASLPGIAPGPNPLELAADQTPVASGCETMSLGGGGIAGTTGLSAAHAAVIGNWVDGHWGTTSNCHALTIEDIRPDGTVTVVFANGATPDAPPTSSRLDGTISETGRIDVALPTGGRVIYALDGTILRGARVVDGTMTPVALRRQ